MTSITISTIFNALLALVASAVMLALAAAPAEASPVRVQISPEELTTPAGRAVLDARLDRAARQACGLEWGRDLPVARARARKCAAEALAGARIQVAELRNRNRMASK